MIISKYLFLTQSENDYYLVQTRIKKIFRITEEIYSAIQHNDIQYLIDSKEREKLENNSILVEEKEEINLLENECKKLDDDKEWNSLHIIPTLSCNMGCDYCFVLDESNNKMLNSKMSEGVLYKAIDMFIEDNPSSKKAMTFYGGEPFVHKDIVFKAVNYANKEYEGQFQYKIVTNGTLIDRGTARFLHTNGFDVNVSLDGNRQAHDMFRKYHDGASTYDDVVNGIKLLMEEHNSVKILMTVGQFNLPILKDCVESVLELGPTSIALNLPKQVQTGDNKIEFDDYKSICETYLECLDLCYEKGIPEAHFADIIYGFLSNEVHYRPCSGCGKQMAVSPDNMVGPCQAYANTGKYFIDFSTVDSKKDLRNNEIFQKWKKITMFSSEKCRQCYLLPICAGDCPFDWENREGSFDNPPNGYCITRKAMFSNFIHRVVSGKKILFRGNR